MKLPTLDNLNHVSQLMHGMDFPPLPFEFKPNVVQIAQYAILADVIDNIPLNIDIAIRELLAEKAKAIGSVADFIDNIDTSLGHVGEWFQKSRLYEP